MKWDGMELGGKSMIMLLAGAELCVGHRGAGRRDGGGEKLKFENCGILFSVYRFGIRKSEKKHIKAVSA